MKPKKTIQKKPRKGQLGKQIAKSAPHLESLANSKSTSLPKDSRDLPNVKDEQEQITNEDNRITNHDSSSKTNISQGD